LGDNMLKDGIRDLITSFEKGEYGAGIALQEVNNPEQFGIIKTDDDGNVTKLIEKPSDPSTNQAIIGIYIFSPVVFDEIEELDPSWRGELEITDAIQSLVNDGHLIDTHPVTGWWKDTGKPGDILDANRLVLQEQEFKTEGTVEQNAETSGQIHLNPSATIASGAVVRGPVSISEGVKIEKGAYVGPYTSIGKNTKLKNTHIENSVIVGDSDITASVRIVDSLIGRGSKIIDGEENLPEGRRFVVGEHSQIKL
jgi:glucose-1-phosphate thymidylyltransferase